MSLIAVDILFVRIHGERGASAVVENAIGGSEIGGSAVGGSEASDERDWWEHLVSSQH